MGNTRISASAVAEVLNTFGVKSHRKQLGRDIEKELQAPTSFGEVMKVLQVPQKLPGATVDFHIICPFALMEFLLERSPSYTAVFKEMIRECPPPWRLCLYADEASTGNLLQVDNHRKTMLVYWQWEGLGRQRLTKATNWHIAGLMRCTTLKKVAGGLSALTRAWLGHCFGLSSFNFNFGAGVLMRPDGHPVIITGAVGSIIADESALKSLLCSMGASGNKPCALCANSCSRDSGLDVPGNDFVSISELSWNGVILHSDETMWAVVDRLQERRPHMTAQAFRQLETSLGFRHWPTGLLCDQALRAYVHPTKIIQYDFLHVYFVGGIVPHELWLLLRRLTSQQVGVTWPMLDRYLQGWRWPKRVKMQPKRCFNAARHDACTKAKAFKAGAGELLGMYEVLRHFIKMIEPSGIEAEVTCFRALCQVIDGYSVLLAGGCPDDFAERVQRHLDLYKDTYPGTPPKFKHHMALHIARHVRLHRVLQTCFVHERKHKVYKQKALPS